MRSKRTDHDTSWRRFGRSSAAGIALAGAAFSWLVTGGTFQFFKSVPFSNFYDVQARALMRGTWSMPASVLSIEGIRTNGRTDMYYGPVLAIARMAVLIFTHRLDGRLTEPSLLLGFVVALVAASLLSWRVRGLVRGTAGVGRLEAGLTAGFIVVIGVGSALFFLGTTAQVYEEAELWGAAFTLGALYALVGFVEQPSARRLVATGVMTTLALLTRGSVGVGPLIALAVIAAVYLVNWMATRAPQIRVTAGRITRVCGLRVAPATGRYSAGLIAAVAIPVALYVVINEIKFGTPFSIPLNHQVYSLENLHRKAVLAANGGSLFGLKFLPTNLLQFLRPDAVAASGLFPWILFPGKALVLGQVLYDTTDWTSSIPASMPVLFVLAVMGILLVYRPARPRIRRAARDAAPPAVPDSEPGSFPGLTALRVPLVGAAAGTVGVLIIAFIAERYLADAMPLVLLAALAGWHVLVPRWITAPRAWRTAGAVLLAVVALFEVWTNFSLSLFYQRELGSVITIPQRAGMVGFQVRVHRSLFGGPVPGVHFVTRLPARAHRLDLAVVGHCAGLYQYDGNLWQPVELGPGGAVGLEVTFPRSDRGQRQPLLVTGAPHPQDVVAVTWEGGDRYRFSYLFAGNGFGSTRTWFSGPALTVAPGRPHDTQVDLVTGVGQVYITVDGAPALSLLALVAPPTVVRVGTAAPSTTTTGRFAGQIRQIPLPTPICDGLARARAVGN